ncbi:MAG TPA: ribose-phosphate pyrophosphokinase [Nitrososphaerales archaeon]|nr:ribose-phosphate pyrophosphokinase [Nitrososphaerales archaeon]
MSEKLVLAGPASEELGKSIASKLGLGVLPYSFRVFPDGESKFTVDAKLTGKSVYVVQSTYPPVDQHLFQLLLVSHHLSQEGAKVTAVIPYLAYARQDKAFLPGEVLSLGVVSHLLRSAGVRRVVTVDIHSAEGLSLFASPIYSVSAIPDLVRYVRSKLEKEPAVVIAPDFGASKRTEAFATLYGSERLQVKKSRDRTTGEVTIEEPTLDVKGKTVLIVDDIISTGGTVEASAKSVIRQGAARVVAVCVHPLLVGEATAKLQKAGVSEIIATNTIPGKFSVVDVTDAISSHLGTLDE